jgi:prepilin-type N-terminal cleavage/methylation domain-containing protein
MKAQNLKIKRGFTLVEMMVALTVGAAVTIVILASFGSLSTSLKATEHYRNMHHDVRHAMDVMRQDIIRGSGVSACVSSNHLVMTTEVSGAGTVSVVYDYNQSSNSLSRTENSGPSVTLATGVVDKVTFTLYDASGVMTTDPASAYFVGVKMEMKKQGVRDTYVDELQIRNRMRAKGL